MTGFHLITGLTSDTLHPCVSSKDKCPLGLENHFDTMEEGLLFIRNKNHGID